MKVITLDIFQFNNWYRFNQKSISNDMIIDFSLENQDFILKTGMFEEEHDIFFAQIPDEIERFKIGTNIYNLPIGEIKSIIPLTEQGRRFLSKRIFDIKLSTPIKPTIAEKIISQRNLISSEQGGNMILSIFGINEDIINPYKEDFLNAVKIYPHKNGTFLSNIISYERTQAFPRLNSGFIFDAGSLLKGDKNLNQYLNVLSLFCKENENNENVFSTFLKEYQNSKELKKLNNSIQLSPYQEDINVLLIIALFFKFRYLIREKRHFDFQKEAKIYLSKKNEIQKEISIALFWVGLFFGIKEFRDMYYQQNLGILKPKGIILEPSKVNDELKISDKKEFNAEEILTELKEELDKSKATKNQKKLIDTYKIKNNTLKDLQEDLILKISNLKKHGKKFTKEDFISLVEKVCEKYQQNNELSFPHTKNEEYIGSLF